ncbi:MAG: PAS domain S-box protein, partial [Flavobacterium sp.]
MLDSCYNKFFNKSINLLCILDKSGSFIDLNDAFVLTFGTSREEFIGQQFLDLI